MQRPFEYQHVTNALSLTLNHCAFFNIHGQTVLEGFYYSRSFIRNLKHAVLMRFTKYGDSVFALFMISEELLCCYLLQYCPEKKRDQ